MNRHMRQGDLLESFFLFHNKTALLPLEEMKSQTGN